jgi:hypothetical protein
MKATNTYNDTTTNHYFNVEHEGKEYAVTMYTNTNGKFVDENITLDGEEIGYEGEEGQIREDIVNYLDENWDDLVVM